MNRFGNKGFDLIIYLVLLLGGFCSSAITFSQPLSFEDLIRRGGLWFDKATETPFSGYVRGPMIGIARGCKGCKVYEGRLVDGKASGVWDYYHDNKQLYQSKTFKNGKLDGDFLSFYYDGSICQRGNYINGKISGQWERYHEDGKPWSVDDRSPECDMCKCGSVNLVE